MNWCGGVLRCHDHILRLPWHRPFKKNIRKKSGWNFNLRVDNLVSRAAASFLKIHQQNKQWSAGAAEAVSEMTALLKRILM